MKINSSIRKIGGISMNATQMFAELGYTKKEHRNGYGDIYALEFEKTILNSKEFIVFYVPENSKIITYKLVGEDKIMWGKELSVEELEATYKKSSELGWIDRLNKQKNGERKRPEVQK